MFGGHVWHVSSLFNPCPPPPHPSPPDHTLSPPPPTPHPTSLKGSKNGVWQLWRRGAVGAPAPWDPPAHAPTNLRHWFAMRKPYIVDPEPGWAPYSLAARAHAPWHDERFRGCGWDQVGRGEGALCAVQARSLSACCESEVETVRATRHHAHARTTPPPILHSPPPRGQHPQHPQVMRTAQLALGGAQFLVHPAGHLVHLPHPPSAACNASYRWVGGWAWVWVGAWVCIA